MHTGYARRDDVQSERAQQMIDKRAARHYAQLQQILSEDAHVHLQPIESVSRLAGGIPYRYGLVAGGMPLYPQGEEYSSWGVWRCATSHSHGERSLDTITGLPETSALARRDHSLSSLHPIAYTGLRVRPPHSESELHTPELLWHCSVNGAGQVVVDVARW